MSRPSVPTCLAVLVSIAACSPVASDDPDAGFDAAVKMPADAAPADTAVDATPADAAPCPVEDFSGLVLDQRWDPTRTVGNAPGYELRGGEFRLTDPKVAATPSTASADDSWVYDIEQDLGNQLVWPVPIGTGAFDIIAQLSWTSPLQTPAPQDPVWIGGIGVTRADGHLEAWTGLSDGSAGSTGNVAAIIRRDGDDATWNVANDGRQGGTFRIARTGTRITVSRNNEVVLEADSTAELANVVILAVRHRSPTGITYGFGSFSIETIAVTHSGCAAR